MENKDYMYKHGPYMYVLKHGMGPGTLPKDVNIVRWKDLDDYKTVIWTDRFLTTKELEDYDVYPETMNTEILGDRYNEFAETKTNVFESLTDTDIDKLGKYNLNDDELSYLLGLFELISDENKAKAFELVDALLLNKNLVAIEAESLKPKKATYTRRLLGDII